MKDLIVFEQNLDNLPIVESKQNLFSFNFPLIKVFKIVATLDLARLQGHPRQSVPTFNQYLNKF